MELRHFLGFLTHGGRRSGNPGKMRSTRSQPQQQKEREMGFIGPSTLYR